MYWWIISNIQLSMNYTTYFQKLNFFFWTIDFDFIIYCNWLFILNCLFYVIYMYKSYTGNLSMEFNSVHTAPPVISIVLCNYFDSEMMNVLCSCVPTLVYLCKRNKLCLTLCSLDYIGKSYFINKNVPDWESWMI